MTDIVILGAGGFAREVLDILRAQAAHRPIGFYGLDTDPDEVKGLPVLRTMPNAAAVGGVGSPVLRRRLGAEAAEFASAIHPSVTFGEALDLPAGTGSPVRTDRFDSRWRAMCSSTLRRRSAMT